MKNLCLLLACLTFISVLPASAMKIIVNNEHDRIVYSRSSGPDEDVSYTTEQTQTTEMNSYLRHYMGNPEYYQYQLRLLGDDIRRELVGTKWYYASPAEPLPSQTISQSSSDNISLERLKRASREAADYYMVDMTKDPNNLVPSGYVDSF